MLVFRAIFENGIESTFWSGSIKNAVTHIHVHMYHIFAKFGSNRISS